MKMASNEDILDALDEYGCKGQEAEIPAVLDEYLHQVASTGETRFPWSKLKLLVRNKMARVLREFHESVSSNGDDPMEKRKFEENQRYLLRALDMFHGAPFTIQRLCELITSPKKHYKRTDKLMRGIHKNLLVVSTVDPFGKKQAHSSPPVINGIDSNGELHNESEENNHFAIPSFFNSTVPVVSLSPRVTMSSTSNSATSLATSLPQSKVTKSEFVPLDSSAHLTSSVASSFSTSSVSSLSSTSVSLPNTATVPDSVALLSSPFNSVNGICASTSTKEAAEATGAPITTNSTAALGSLSTDVDMLDNQSFQEGSVAKSSHASLALSMEVDTGANQCLPGPPNPTVVNEELNNKEAVPLAVDQLVPTQSENKASSSDLLLENTACTFHSEPTGKKEDARVSESKLSSEGNAKCVPSQSNEQSQLSDKESFLLTLHETAEIIHEPINSHKHSACHLASDTTSNAHSPLKAWAGSKPVSCQDSPTQSEEIAPQKNTPLIEITDHSGIDSTSSSTFEVSNSPRHIAETHSDAVQSSEDFSVYSSEELSLATTDQIDTIQSALIASSNVRAAEESCESSSEGLENLASSTEANLRVVSGSKSEDVSSNEDDNVEISSNVNTNEEISSNDCSSGVSSNVGILENVSSNIGNNEDISSNVDSNVESNSSNIDDENSDVSSNIDTNCDISSNMDGNENISSNMDTSEGVSSNVGDAKVEDSSETVNEAATSDLEAADAVSSNNNIGSSNERTIVGSTSVDGSNIVSTVNNSDTCVVSSSDGTNVSSSPSTISVRESSDTDVSSSKVNE